MGEIFISYSHLNDQRLPGTDSGWVKCFHDALEMILRDLGVGAESWRDEKIGGNDFLTPVILQALADCQVLVSVMSPEYVRSEWCLRELQTFCEGRGYRFGNQSRIFKVVRTDFLPQDIRT